MTTFTLDPNYGYAPLPIAKCKKQKQKLIKHSFVLIAAASTFILGTIHGLNTGTYRKAAACPYPAAYAPSSRTDRAAYQFNCAQRAHSNFIENQPSLLAALLISGTRFPLTSAVFGGVWTASRWIYMKGYTTSELKDGKGRYAGGLVSYFCFRE